MSKVDLTQKKCTTPKFRASYVHVKAPHAMKGSEPRYGVTMLFDKTTDLSVMKKAATNAVAEKYGSFDKRPKGFKWPFRSGDLPNQNGEEQPPEYKGKIFVSARAKEQPGVVDNKKQELMDLSEFYSGCYARATLIAFVYETGPNKGVSFALLNLQKLGDGKKIGGKKEAKDDFDEAEDESENPDNYPSEEQQAEEGEEATDDGGF